MNDPLVEAIRSKFEDFFEQYYRAQLDELMVSFPEKRSMLIDVKDLGKFDPDLANELIDKPDIVIEAANEALKNKLGESASQTEQLPHSRFFGQTINTPMVQDVGSAFIGKLILLDGLIVKRSEISPKARIDAYVCGNCESVFKFRADKDEVPELCPQCKKKALKQDPSISVFTNFQKIAVQDPLERLRGNTPTWQLEIWMDDDTVNTVIPGDRVDITGILRIRPRRNAKGKAENNLYTMFVESVSILTKQKEFADIQITEEEERQILELSKDPQIFERIAKSVAPSIYGFDEIKQAVALQLFGGTQGKFLVDGGRIRSDTHILLIGDPGSAKTRILQSVIRLVPKGIYVSGKSVTGGGMTAVAERDEFSESGWTLKAGAMVLGNGGVVAIDEFDKIGEEDRASLHEALESQTISVAKAGIVATFNARTAVLAAANPRFGRFDPHQYPAEQFNIPTTLLSRFDLVFPIKDIMDEEQDKKIARHILTQHEAAGAELASVSGIEQVERPPIEIELFRKYIAYARKNINPRLSEDASKKIQEYYIDLRRQGARSGTTAITPRQIEGLVRMAESSAKTRLSQIVELIDAERSINLAEYMMKTLAVDTSGRRDIDTILTGQPREKVDKMNMVLSIIKKLEGESGGTGAKYQQVLDEASKAGIEQSTASKYISELDRAGDIYSPRSGILKTVKRTE
jgi:replicative DNA helicase Mcm